ncbi:MAG: hypothetical protein ACFFED_14130 [Candidatus Thorarchaeota archaeon]
MPDSGKKREPKPRKGPTFEEIEERAYDRISWYATRFMITATIGVVIGVIGMVYAVLMLVVFGAALQDLNVFVGAFIGVGAIVASLVLLAWGFFWRKKADLKSIF